MSSGSPPGLELDRTARSLGASSVSRRALIRSSLVSLPLGLVAWAIGPSTMFAGPILFSALGLVPLAFALIVPTFEGAFVRRWVLTHLPAALPLAVSFFVPPGPLAAWLTVPWLVWTLPAAYVGRSLFRTRKAADALVGFALFGLFVGAAFVLAARAGAEPLGLSAYLVELTALHFHAATLVPPIVISSAFQAGLFGPRAVRFLTAGAIAGPVLIGYGTTEHRPTASAGALLLAAALLLYALRVLASSRDLPPAARPFLVASSIALFVSMPLVVVFSVSRALGAPVLDLSSIYFGHGYLNAFGFALPALLGWLRMRVEREGSEWRHALVVEADR